MVQKIQRSCHSAKGKPQHRYVMEWKESTEEKSHKIRIKTHEAEFLRRLHSYNR